jgi:DNA-binding winged helix-turn-helix (wHTH) protein/tetratricopeptide (TPR) repeat protein
VRKRFACAPMNADRPLAFEGFSLDLANEQLVCGGEVVALTPKAFAVLRRLVEGGGQLVTKEELLRAGWPKTHVSDGVLKVIVLEIRRAFGDDPAAPRFIETVPRRGYRFIAPRMRPARVPAAGAAHGALVGRDDVLAQLEERLARAQGGQRQIVFLTGEAGIGKTTVLEAFVARARADPDLMIASGACLEHYGAAEPYFPVLEALGRLLRESVADRVIALLETHAPTWLAQLPWLKHPGDREALRHELQVTKERMLREMAEALEALTAKTALVLVLEDLHWSDYSTLDLLGMLARREEAARLLVIGSYRSVDVIVKPHPLRALIQELRMRRQCENIALTFLHEPHVAAYLAQRFGVHALPSELARAVHQWTDGNPLFMVRVVDELVALRVVEPEDDRWRLSRPVAEIGRAVPEDLRALIEKQIDRLQPEAQRLLEAASVLGNEFTIGSVAAGLDVDPLAIEGCCDELARQGQFVSAAGLFEGPDGTKVARYRFTHSLYPHAIAERVLPGWRLRLHQRVGEWLEHAYAAETRAIAAPLAWHFEEAGDHQRAIRYLILTAENATRRCAYGDAIRVLQQARSLVRHLAADAGSKLDIELLQCIGDAHFGRGAMIECAEAYETAAARAADAGFTAAQVDALGGLVRPLCFIDPDRGMAAIEQALQLSANLDDPLPHARTDLLGAYVRLTFDTWREQDWEICESASETIHRLSDAGLDAFDRVIYAHLEILRGDYAEALKKLEAGIPKENESTGPAVHFLAFSGKALALLYSGRLGELVQLLRAGREIAEKNSNEPWLFVLREAWLRVVVLDCTGARELCEAMVARNADAYWHGQSQTVCWIATGYAALQQEKYDDALRSFAQVLDSKKPPKVFLHWYWRMNAELGLSNVWLASGNLRKARLEADRFLQSALSTAEPNLHALAWEVGARVAMAEKDWSDAEEKIEKGLAVLQNYEIPTTAWRVHATRSDLYRQARNETAAEAHRAHAEAIILALADSFAPDDPLRHLFLAAAPVRRVRAVSEGNRRGRQRRVPL